MNTTTAPAPRTLAQLHNRETSYEVAVDLPDGSTHRLGFTSRPSRARFIGFAREHKDLILPHLTDDDDRLEYSRATGLQLGPVRIYKTGLTERECKVLALEAAR